MNTLFAETLKKIWMEKGLRMVYLAACPDYSLNEWDTGTCGFMVKPLTPEGVRRQQETLSTADL